MERKKEEIFNNHHDNNDKNSGGLPPPVVISGKRGPDWNSRDMLHCVVCLMCLAFLLWTSCFVVMCILLHRANTLEVKTACAGFWDFMLLSLLTPILIPTMYCFFSWVMWWGWYPFSGSCMFVMGIFSLHMTLNALENAACVEAVRSTSGPVPWLIYVGMLKSVIYCAGAISSLFGHVFKRAS